MTTFVLKKYQEKTEEAPQPTEGTSEGATPPPEEEQQITINVDSSVAEIVAKTLLEILGTRATIKQLEEKEEQPANNQQALVITTESINNDPIATLRSVSPNDILLITNEGFHTEKEEWFLTNVTNKTPTVFYSVESFVKHISSLFQETSVEG